MPRAVGKDQHEGIPSSVNVRRAGEVAGSVPGVKSVKNDLVVI